MILKSVGSLENKGVIAACPPYPSIRFYTILPLLSHFIRAKTRESKFGGRITSYKNKLHISQGEINLTMISMEAYKRNPCKVSSIPYWKVKKLTIPSNIKIIHNDEFNETILDNYFDRRFFRLIHNLSNIPEFNIAGIKLEVIQSNRNDELADMINRSYAHSEIRVSTDYVNSLSTTQVYCPELWLGAVLDGKLIGFIICDFDIEVGEAIIEWLQVLPEYRSRGIASGLICKALKTMSSFANFATVSGECDNITNPERVYRHCGFEGNDIWHILNEK